MAYDAVATVLGAAALAVGPTTTAAAAAAAAAAAVQDDAQCTPAQGLALSTTFCNTVALSQCPAARPLLALRSGCAYGPTPEWRCYSPECLNANHTAYKQGSGCTGYCTRDAEIKRILATCQLPPAPPPPVYSNATEVFTPGEGGYPCIRIPSIALAGDNVTLNAFAECRNWTGDGCIPLMPLGSHEDNVRTDPSGGSIGDGGNSGNSNRDICMKSSVDGGRTWSPLRVIARNGAQGSPVYDARTNKLLLQYMQLTPADTMQMESTDHGATWTKPRSVCGTLPTADCGGAVGPGVGIQLRQGPHKGRLLFIGHWGAYGHDQVWFSDDDGGTWSAAQSNLSHMDEAQLVELPNGDVMANMRTNHLNATCKCRAVARSADGGATWGPVGFDPTLTSPVCMASILRSGEQVYFANPSSTTTRSHGVLRRSPDGARWGASAVVWPGAYAYSCLSEMPGRAAVGVLWETDGPQCKPGGASCRTVFSVFPADF